MEFVHKSVMFEEALSALNLRDGTVIADGTAGGGGHSSEIAKRIPNGRLIAIDRDPDAINVLTERLSSFPNVKIVNDSFSNIKEILPQLNETGADGILLDLGVSSFQLDNAERGFSFHKDAPLDMRMSKKGLSAADVVNTYSKEELANIIFKYGEEKFARSIASNIVKARESKRIETTFELVDIIKSSMPQKAMRDSHPARRTFQAIRIEVNGELDELNKMLDDGFECLNAGGRFAIITFHSLEDRAVKEKFNEWCRGCTCPKEFPVCVCGNEPKGFLPFKSKAPSNEELEENPRAHSARLRVFEKY